MNLEIRKLEETIVSVVNSSQIPTEVKRLVVADVLHKLEVQADKEVMLEVQMAKQNEEKECEQHE